MAITEEKFLEVREGVLANIREKDTSIYDRAEKHWAEIRTNQFIFNRMSYDENLVLNLTLSDVKDEFVSIFNEKKRVFEVHI